MKKVDERVKPINPFTLPPLKDEEIIYKDSRTMTASTLAAYYIAARFAGDPELSFRADSDIGAFMSEDIGTDEREQYAYYSTRFAELIDQIDKEFPLDYQRSWIKQ